MKIQTYRIISYDRDKNEVHKELTEEEWANMNDPNNTPSGLNGVPKYKKPLNLKRNTIYYAWTYPLLTIHKARKLLVLQHYILESKKKSWRGLSTDYWEGLFKDEKRQQIKYAKSFACPYYEELYPLRYWKLKRKRHKESLESWKRWVINRDKMLAVQLAAKETKQAQLLKDLDELPEKFAAMYKKHDEEFALILKNIREGKFA